MRNGKTPKMPEKSGYKRRWTESLEKGERSRLLGKKIEKKKK